MTNMSNFDYEKAKALMDQWEERHNQATASYQDMFNREREAYERLLGQCECYRKALESIANTAKEALKPSELESQAVTIGEILAEHLSIPGKQKQ